MHKVRWTFLRWDSSIRPYEPISKNKLTLKVDHTVFSLNKWCIVFSLKITEARLICFVYHDLDAKMNYFSLPKNETFSLIIQTNLYKTNANVYVLIFWF